MAVFSRTSPFGERKNLSRILYQGRSVANPTVRLSGEKRPSDSQALVFLLYSEVGLGIVSSHQKPADTADRDRSVTRYRRCRFRSAANRLRPGRACHS